MRRSALPLLLCCAAACAAPQGPAGAPLVDAGHAPDVLVESRALALPPDTGGNRFVAGWWPRRGEGGLRLVPGEGGAVLEGVHLGTSPRRLRLTLEGTLPERATAAVEIAGRDAVAVPVAAGALEVPLPADLPRGRFPVRLRFPAGADVAVRGGGFDAALPAGEVTVAGGDVRQAGVSLVEIVRPLAGAATLAGRFVPPPAPAPGQRFELRAVDADGGETLLWDWEASWWQRLRGDRPLRIPVAAAAGWLRLRLLAATPGPAATWQGLSLLAGDGAERPEAPTGAASEPTGTGPASPPQPRLVVLYAFDALRADAVGHLGGDPAATPVLDALAAAGVTFRHHAATAPNTLPSTKTLLTGRIWRQRGGWALAADGPETLAEAFRRAGWRTGLFSGNVYVSEAYGLDRGFEAAPREALYESYAERERPPYNDNAERVHRAALDWLASLPPGERAFLYLHPVHPHNPYDPPAPFRARFAGAASAGAVDGSTETLLAVRNQRLALDATGRQRLAGLYRGGLAYADAQLGAFLAAVEQRFPREEVLVAVTADHGEELFDHGGVLHGYTLYEEQLRIPLVLRWPGGVAAGRVVDEPTDTVDLHTALRALAARRATADSDAPALDEDVVWRLAAGAPVKRTEPRLAAAASLKGGIYAARTPRWKVVWAPRTGTQWGMGEGLGRSRDAELVFDLAADPGERRNLVGFADDPEVLWLRSRLLAWAQQPEPAEDAAPEPTDEATRRKLEALGYVD